MLPKLIRTRRFVDERGWFAESYSAERFAAAGIRDLFVQDNHSLSARKGTLRGLHFQARPHAQAKLVRCTSGAVWDVLVDLRSGSPTRGRWVAAELTAASGDQVYVPVGFAHGFLSLTDGAEVQYKVTSPWAPSAEGVIRWDDAELDIAWPLTGGSSPTLSPRDAAAGGLNDITADFAYDGVPFDSLEVLSL